MAGSIEATVPDDQLVRSSLPTLHQVTVSLVLVLGQKHDLLMSHLVPIGFHYSEYYLAVALGESPCLTSVIWDRRIGDILFIIPNSSKGTFDL